MKSCEITIRVTPRSSCNAVELHGDLIKVRITSPPVDGEANVSVCKTLAKALRIGPSYVLIVKGNNSRIKTIQVQTLTQEDIFLLLSQT